MGWCLFKSKLECVYWWYRRGNIIQLKRAAHWCVSNVCSFSPGPLCRFIQPWFEAIVGKLTNHIFLWWFFSCFFTVILLDVNLSVKADTGDLRLFVLSTQLWVTQELNEVFWIMLVTFPCSHVFFYADLIYFKYLNLVNFLCVFYSLALLSQCVANKHSLTDWNRQQTEFKLDGFNTWWFYCGWCAHVCQNLYAT